MSKKLTQEEFLVKAVAVHGNRYDYSLLNYSGSKDKVAIICAEHGKFEQWAFSHLSGKNCPNCKKSGSPRKGLYSDNNALITTAQVKYPLLKFEKYLIINHRTGGIVICPKHGEFLVRPSQLLNAKVGCRKCSRDIQSRVRPVSRAEYIARAQIIHKGKYDYAMVSEGVSGKEKVQIVCPKHGVFLQELRVHCRSSCPVCGKENRQSDWISRANNRPSILYLLRVFNENEVFYKVGITCPGVEARFKRIRDLKGYEYEVMRWSS